MGAAVEESALLICIRETLDAFLADHEGCEHADIEVFEVGDVIGIEVNGFAFNLILEPLPGCGRAEGEAD